MLNFVYLDSTYIFIPLSTELARDTISAKKNLNSKISGF